MTTLIHPLRRTRARVARSARSRARGERGAVALGLAGMLIPTMAVVGFGGYELEHALFGGSASPATRIEVAAYSCPGRSVAGTLHSGDRVFVIGLSDTPAGWLLIRNPQRPDQHWWVEQRYVHTDRAVTDLPKTGCARPLPQAAGGPAGSVPATLSPTASPTATTSTTAAASPSRTRTPSATASRTPTPPPRTTASAPRTTASAPNSSTKPPVTTPASSTPATSSTPPPPPVVVSVNAKPTTITEADSGTICTNTPGDPTSTTITASVQHASSVTLTWTVGPAPRSTAMTHHTGDSWTATLGPFGADTVVSTTPITVTVAATGPGGTAHKQASVTLDNCVAFG